MQEVSLRYHKLIARTKYIINARALQRCYRNEGGGKNPAALENFYFSIAQVSSAQLYCVIYSP